MLDPHHLHRVVDVVDDAVERGPLRVDRKRMKHDPDDAAVCCESAQGLVREVPRVVVHRAARRVADDDRRLRRAFEDVQVRLRPGVGEVEDQTELDAEVDQLPAQLAQASGAGLCRTVGEWVAPIPRQRQHPDAQLPHRLRDPRVVAERLGSFEREHQPDALAAFDGGQVGLLPHRDDAVCVLPDGAVERGDLPEALPGGRLSGRNGRSTKTGHTWSATLPPSRCGSQRAANGFVSPCRCRSATSTRRSLCPSTIAGKAASCPVASPTLTKYHTTLQNLGLAAPGASR